MSNEVAVQEAAQPPQLNELQADRVSALAIITSDENMNRVMKFAETMASSKVTVPKHLQQNVGDCAAIVMQAAQWGMNPFAVAQKTHLVNGALGYEAQLVIAVLQSLKVVEGNLQYEYSGSGENLTCRVGAIPKGRDEVLWGEPLTLSSVTTRNSPLWKTNPEQQLGYLQAKNWARKYYPGAILGVYTPDELELMPEKELNPIRRNGAAVAERATQATGNLIDPENEERRTGLVTALEAYAQKGVAVFGQEWKKMGKANKGDVYLVGEAEYQRLLKIATGADQAAQSAGQEPEENDGFVSEMEAEEQKQP